MPLKNSRSAKWFIKKYFDVDRLSDITASKYLDFDIKNLSSLKCAIQAIIIKEKSAVLRLIGRYQESHRELDKGLLYSKKSGDRKLEADCFLGKGILEVEFGHIENAKKYAATALAIANELNKPTGKAETHTLFGRISVEEGDWENAEDNFVKAIDIYSGIKQPFKTAIAQYYYARVLKNKNLDKAKNLIDQAKLFFNKCGALEWVKRCEQLEE